MALCELSNRNQWCLRARPAEASTSSARSDALADRRGVRQPEAGVAQPLAGALQCSQGAGETFRRPEMPLIYASSGRRRAPRLCAGIDASPGELYQWPGGMPAATRGLPDSTRGADPDCRVNLAPFREYPIAAGVCLDAIGGIPECFGGVL